MSLWLKLGLAAGALVILATAYFAWTYHQREIGRQEIIAKDAKEIAEQAVKDRALSERLVIEREARIVALEANAGKVREVIRNVPVTTGCGPAVRNAADWVRESLPQAGR